MSELAILIIRHAEKPGETWPGPGLTVDGAEDKKSLVLRGWQRAGAWAALFGGGRGGAEYPAPAKIYAAKPDKDDEAADPSTADHKPSQRPYETILPLAARLSLAPQADLAKGQEQSLAQKLLAETGVVVVCWEHKAIVGALLPALLAGQQVAGVPQSWDPARFDVVLRLDRAAPGAPWLFRQLFPQLLSGDSDAPLS